MAGHSCCFYPLGAHGWARHGPLNHSLLPSSLQLMGHWSYIGGASRYPPHQEEMKVLKHAVFTLSPGSHEDEINVTEILRV